MLVACLFQANEEKEEMRALQEYNMKLVGNILPMHVAEHFLKTQMRKDEVEINVFAVIAINLGQTS